MVSAAQKLVDSLSADQKAKALIAFDSKERFNWNFVPLQDKEKKSTRKGLPLEADVTVFEPAPVAPIAASGSTTKQRNR